MDLSRLSNLAVVAAAVGISCVAYLVLTVKKIARDPAIPDQWLPRGKPQVLFEELIKFPEDLIIDHEKGLAIISADPGRHEWNTVMGPMKDPNPRGHLFIYEYGTTGKVKDLTLLGYPTAADFHPLGINFYREAGGPTRVFVVNHGRYGSSVEVFDVNYDEETAKHIITITDGDRNILSPNAVAPVSYTKFYVTNDHYCLHKDSKALSLAETIFEMPWSWITFVDFTDSPKMPPQTHVAVNGFPFANGIAVTPTGKQVLIGSTSECSVRIYERNPETNNLSHTYQTVHFNCHVDNVSFDMSLKPTDRTAFDEDGHFLRGALAAGSPSGRRMAVMAEDPSKNPAPSLIGEIFRGMPGVRNPVDRAPLPAGPTINSGTLYYAKTAYQSNGNQYPGVTTGQYDGKRNRLLACGLYARGILDITLPKK